MMPARRASTRIAVPDLVSPSYFPAIAAVELGFVAERDVDAQLDLLYPVTDAAAALRDGEIDFLAGAAHAPLAAFPDWNGVKLLVALSRNMYWFLVIRADLETPADGVRGLHDIRIGAAPGPDLGLLQLLDEAGVDRAASGIEVGPVPTGGEKSISFGVTAAKALADRRIDAFWANGMAAELAVREGSGKVLVDARRGGSPAGASSYTFPALATTERMLREQPGVAYAVAQAVVDAQNALRESPERATAVGERVFPPLEATLIADLVSRDLPFYDPAITEQAVADMNAFARRAGLLDSDSGYEHVVALDLSDVWTGAAT